MKNLCGYLGLFQPPLNGYMSSIYCVATPDKRNLVMVPLVANFFETAYSVAKEPEYQRIFLVLPSLDMLLISDAYLFYYEIAKKLNKKVEIFCNDKPQIPVTDEFYSHIHVYSMDKTLQFTDYLNNDENFDIKVEYRTQFRPINRSAADIYISTNGKRILFCEYMSKVKLDNLEQTGDIDFIDEIHIPFMKNFYGGMNYIETRRNVSPKYLSKFYAFGFASKEEAELCASGVGKFSEVKYNDFV